MVNIEDLIEYEELVPAAMNDSRLAKHSKSVSNTMYRMLEGLITKYLTQLDPYLINELINIRSLTNELVMISEVIIERLNK